MSTPYVKAETFITRVAWVSKGDDPCSIASQAAGIMRGLLDERAESHGETVGRELPARWAVRYAVDRIVGAVAELPDRTSPDDWPDAMLVTADELRAIVTAEIEAMLVPADLIAIPEGN